MQVSSLKKRLRGDKADKGAAMMVGDGLARSFLKAMVALIGNHAVYTKMLFAVSYLSLISGSCC